MNAIFRADGVVVLQLPELVPVVEVSTQHFWTTVVPTALHFENSISWLLRLVSVPAELFQLSRIVRMTLCGGWLREGVIDVLYESNFVNVGIILCRNYTFSLPFLL